MTHLRKRFYPLEPDPEAPPYLDDAYHSTLLAMRGTEVVIGSEYNYFLSAPVEAERKMQRARISAKEGRVSRNTRLSLDSETGLETRRDGEEGRRAAGR